MAVEGPFLNTLTSRAFLVTVRASARDRGLLYFESLSLFGYQVRESRERLAHFLHLHDDYRVCVAAYGVLDVDVPPQPALGP